MTPATVWFTGLSGAGKTTVAEAVAKVLRERGQTVVMVDGDDVRKTLCADLGFDAASRIENTRRCAAVAELTTRCGAITLVALISPHRSAREAAKALHASRGLAFFEVWLSAPVSVVSARDPKRLYARAREGELNQMSGVDSVFEPPLHPDLELSHEIPLEDSLTKVLALLTPSPEGERVGERDSTRRRQ